MRNQSVFRRDLIISTGFPPECILRLTLRFVLGAGYRTAM
ncbi:Protein of unknown function [Pyronema omphalodes CBS 100304]|uniref:Uncharacterized protein n=1 Tax=Pyronema omphalodes (strain CBS 100304) TaxID=1076935 RepID=U4L6C8_PYROM|nr:Protein of unknown function [Pyronema omphalodes CBS 100304]